IRLFDSIPGAREWRSFGETLRNPDFMDSNGRRQISGYCSRWDFLLKKCTNKTVLHLGCIGETDCSLDEKLEAFRTGRALHPNLIRVASDVVGIDLNAAAVHLVRTKAGIDRKSTRLNSSHRTISYA